MSLDCPNRNFESSSETSTQNVIVDHHHDVNFSTLLKLPQHENFVARRDFPRRNLSTEFLSSAVPASILFVVLVVVFALLLCFKRQGEREEHWRGFVESFFLVVKVSCSVFLFLKNHSVPLWNKQLAVSIPRLSASSCHLLGKINTMGIYFSK